MRASYTEEAIIQNLKDAGCCPEKIECFMKEYRNNQKADSLKLLAAHRRELLDNLHREQKCMEGVDYLVYDIEKQDDLEKADAIEQTGKGSI